MKPKAGESKLQYRWTWDIPQNRFLGIVACKLSFARGAYDYDTIGGHVGIQHLELRMV